MAQKLTFFVNGKKVEDGNADPETTLLTYLRTNLRLTGTKLGCGEGGCGACTVMVSKWDKEKGHVTHMSVNACLAPVVSMHLCAVTTIEGIGSTKTKLHVVQERLAKFHGSQCGFCTPGIVMSMYTLLRNNPEPPEKLLDEYLQGNLCRCTGYRPIIAAFQTFTKGPCGMGSKCCKLKNGGKSGEEITANGEMNEFSAYDDTQEPIFPPELRVMSGEEDNLMKFVGERSSWFVPTETKELLKLRRDFPKSRIVGGNTEVGIETTIKGFLYTHFISPVYVKEMHEISITDEGIELGAGCTLTNIRETLRSEISKRKEYSMQIQSSLVEMLRWFAGEQIRNVAAIGGNIMTSSPISDLNPILTAARCKLTFQKLTKEDKIVTKEVAMDASFFTGYRRTSCDPEDVLIRIKIPFTSENDVFRAYKQSKRRDDDIAIVNAAFHLHLHDNSDVVKTFSIAYGGVSATTLVPVKSQEKCMERSWNDQLAEDMSSWLEDEINIPADAPGGMVEYRRTLIQSLFFKFYLEVKTLLHQRGIIKDEVVERDLSAIKSNANDEQMLVAATQTWEDVSEDQPEHDKVGRPMMHLSALKQVTGEARYVDDMPRFQDELYLSLVTSTEAHAKILDVDISEASKCPGFVDYVSYKDVPGKNHVWTNDEVYAENLVTCIGHIIGAVVADTATHAQRAARLVKIKYDVLEPIVTIQDAMKKCSYYEDAFKQMIRGNPESSFVNCEYILEGEVKCNAQEHFYLETNACIAIPKMEDGEMDIIASTQHATLTQTCAADALGIDRNKIVVRMKRIGGGFGGKETRSIILSTAVAVAANKCGKPVRCMLTRQEDMVMTGTRHSYYSKYKVGFNKEGQVHALDVDYYHNAGNTLDLSASVMSKTLLLGINGYNVPNVRFRGYVCKTNVSSNTAFRGFGAPQGMLVSETWITHIAEHLNVDAEKIRNINLWKMGDTTPYNQTIDSSSLVDCWDACLAKNNIQKRRDQVNKFNSQNRWKKRGLAVVPTTYGIAYQLFLYQAGALVMVYTDGSVLISHGGMEMGQGLHTKMIQIASKVFGIETNRIHISETSTNCVPNTSASAASVSSDLYGMAVKNACDKINSNIGCIKKQNPEWSWNKVIQEAYMQRIQLSATGFYKPEGLDHTWDNKTGKLPGKRYFSYYTSGAAVSEVEIDCLTGDHVVLQTDIVMDLGRSLNPSVDVGQIEGAFAQGYGLFTLEDPLYSPKGKLWTVGPGAYKIPGFGDIPKRFNVHLLPKSENKHAIYSSKAVGEPPFFLASSVFFAIREAVKSARKDVGITGYFRFDSPASTENIRMSCVDEFSKKSKRAKDYGVVPWAVRI